ncbi:hypothetical protein FBU30_009783 [Linnemannia zychae]|nr:hypothetical protein FBU30_009783 [Linnemannia zychae]
MNYGQQPKSVLETYIERACDPSRYEPDLALNLEICDVIKEKQKNTQVISLFFLMLSIVFMHAMNKMVFAFGNVK